MWGVRPGGFRDAGWTPGVTVAGGGLVLRLPHAPTPGIKVPTRPPRLKPKGAAAPSGHPRDYTRRERLEAGVS